MMLCESPWSSVMRSNSSGSPRAASPRKRPAAAAPKAIEEAKAQQAYETICSQCHELADVERSPPASEPEVTELLRRMIEDNEMKATDEQLDLIEWYMIKKFVHRG